MNVVFFVIVLIAFGTAAWNQLTWIPVTGMDSPMERLTKAMVDSAGSAVELALGLVGVMTLFLGLMKVAEAGGLLRVIARLIRPLMVRLFPDVPPEHPAMGAMILNLSANVMGLGNAATPFGIRAMQELNTLNPYPGTATNAMVLFLAINTASVTLLPTGVIALRASAGSADPAGILPTTLFASLVATISAIFVTRALQKLFPVRDTNEPDAVEEGAGNSTITAAEQSPAQEEAGAGYPPWVSGLALGAVVAVIPLTIFSGRAISPWIIPGLMISFLAFGMARGVRIYEVLVDGAREGFQVAVRIIPYLVAILVAIGMFRASGAMEIMVKGLGGWTNMLGLPPEGLTLAILRSLSGSGAFAVLASFIKDPAIGPDSYTGYLISTIQGSSETTFYVLAVYFGSVQIRRIRHALAAGIIADLVAVIASVVICKLLHG
jgi:spore maturation protein SpmA/spore maturation protein SpmB